MSVPDWVTAGAWEHSRWGPEAPLPRRILGWLEGPVAFCSETCATRFDAKRAVAATASVPNATHLPVRQVAADNAQRVPALSGRS
jgi:hypothetical protein